MQWATTRRLNRILTAIRGLPAHHRRWQSVVRVNPENYLRAQGTQTHQESIRIGIPSETRKAYSDLVQAVAARSALRAMPYIETSETEKITLHPWTENISMGEPRWGGPYAEALPDKKLAYPLDGELWKNLHDDAVVGRQAVHLTNLVSESINSSSEPLAVLFFSSIFDEEMMLPAEWQGADRRAISQMFSEALSAKLRQQLGGTAEAVLLAELAVSPYQAGLSLPADCMSVIRDDVKTWKTRATSPEQLLEEWAIKLEKLDDDLLAQMFDAALQEQATSRVLGALFGRSKATQLDSEKTWKSEPGTVQAQPVLTLLEKLDPDGFADILKQLKEGSGKFLGKSKKLIKEKAAEYLARQSLLYAFDSWFREFHRENAELIEVSYDERSRLNEEERRGGLYLFAEGVTYEGSVVTSSLGAGPVAGQSGGFQTGHLFADLKGFTALTGKLRETEIRHFLQQNFYGPLLRLAKEYFKGGTDLADRGGIRLNNLLGDAISLCGDPLDLLKFSENAIAFIQTDLHDALARATISEAALEEMTERETIEEQIHQLKLQKAQGDVPIAELNARIAALQAKLASAEHDRTRPLDLDMGIFVSYGDAPIDLKISDDLFGDVYVALADKINESARGVARNSDLETLLDRMSAGQENSERAFRVFVGPVLSGEVPDELCELWPNEPDDVAMLARTASVTDHVSGTTAMYNVGIAVSPDTFKEILKAQQSDVQVLNIKTADLLPLLDKAFFIPEPTQTFIQVQWDNGVRILRRCGRVAMKGFAQPPVVWEWLDPKMAVFQSLTSVVNNKGDLHPAEAVLEQFSN